MLISKKTIEEVENLPLSTVIGKYVELKKSGSGYSGLSPFTEEKTPSFHVSDSKSLWKCFSSGKGGNNPITFVMEVKTLDFPEAVKEIAGQFNILLEYDDSKSAKEFIRQQQKKAEINDINQSALEYFIVHRDEMPAEHIRMSEATLEEMSIGFAPQTKDGLFTWLKNKGYSREACFESGLVSQNKMGQSYDTFQGRVIFPVYDRNGKLNGFTGKRVDGQKEFKYLNSKDSAAFNKSKALLGIHLAKAEMKGRDEVIVVEGNYDVSACRDQNLNHVVAPLGTAFTEDHIEEIMKYTKNFILFRDNDKAGLAKIERDTISILEKGGTVRLVIPSEEGQDPWDMIHQCEVDFKDQFKSFQIDAVNYLAEDYFKDATTDIEKTKALSNLSKLLASVSDHRLRKTYIQSFAKTHKIDKSTVEQDVKVEILSRKEPEEDETPDGYRLPSFLSKEDMAEWNEFGFFPDRNIKKIGYYFGGANYSLERITNFLIIPLFQIKSYDDSSRIMQIDNGVKQVMLQVPNKAFSSVNYFEEIVANFGNFRFDGTKKHLNKIRAKIFPRFEFCDQIQTLGWNKNGFYAFANGIAERKFIPVDPNGIVRHADNNYFLPAYSKIAELLTDEDDVYEVDKQFTFKGSKVSFSEWAKQFDAVFADHNNGKIAILFLLASLFRDLIFKMNQGSFPLLYGFGTVETGKSSCARSISKVFYSQTAPLMLPTSTRIAIARKLARVRNSIVWLDEYDNNLDKDKFDLLKNSFDGGGRETGNIKSKYSTDNTKPNSSIFSTGQYLPTRDDNSLLTRMIVLNFTKKSAEFTMKEKTLYTDLIKMEDNGLSNILVEALQFRDVVEDEFEKTLFRTESDLKMKLQGKEPNGRILTNAAILLSMHRIFEERLNLPFNYETIEEVLSSIVIHQSEQVVDSNILANYWKMMEYLYEQQYIQENKDFKIETKHTVRIRVSRDEIKDITFDKPTKLLFIRFAKIHPLYLENHRKQHGENGQGETIIKNYMKSQKYFVGNAPAVDFEGKQTSAYVFDYDAIGINLEPFNYRKVEDEKPQHATPATDDLPF
ncbi:MAG: DNA primase [Crocinitomicaceae bacterium]|jgi:DNA primase catalytic core|nr:DNA primase [Crocinitomicaceae bacterium]